MIYNTRQLLDKYSSYSNSYNKLKRELSNNNIFKIIRGLYTDDKNVDRLLLSQFIYGPSYISFDFVLSLEGLIPERVNNITCASFNKNKTKIFTTNFGNFIYEDVPKDVFSFGLRTINVNEYSYVIATAEKAICDKLYKVRQVHIREELQELLFDDLRIDKSLLLNLDLSLLIDLASKYKRNNLRLLIEYVKKEANIKNASNS